jgi:ribosomal-protein-alanine N-acetyltransferase
MSFHPQVRLLGATVSLLSALNDNRALFGELIGSSVPDGWPEFPEAIGFTLAPADRIRS